MILTIAAICALASVPASAQWTAATNISNSPGYWSGPADIDFDASGKVHMVYEDWWDAYHEIRYANDVGGAWSQSVLKTDAKSPCIRITPDQVMHVFYKAKYGDKNHILEITKPLSGGSWSAPQSITPDYVNGDEWICNVAMDVAGGLYVVWLHLWADDTADPSAIWGRYKPFGGTWGTVEMVRKDTRDHWPANAQVTASGTKFYILYELNGAKYKVWDSGVLSAEKTISGSGGSPRLAFSPNGEMAAAWAEDIGGNAWYEAFVKFSNDGGSTWGTPINISSHNGLDRIPEITYDATGSFHIIYQRFDYDGAQPDIWMASRIGGVWSPITNITNTSGRTAAFTQSIRARGNDLHFFYSDNSENGVEDVFYKVKLGVNDPTPPGAVTSFVAAAGENRVQLTWHNPADPDYMATMVRMSTAGYPAGPFSDTLVCIRTAAPDSTDSYLVYPLTAGTRCYFSAFAQDFAGNWSVLAQATEVPLADYNPPANVNPFTAAAQVAPGTIGLTWTNPSDIDFKGTMVRFKTTGYPTSPTDGSLACNITGAPGSQGSFSHSGLTNGVTYYYRAFAYDQNYNYAGGVNASAAPREPTCGWVKSLPNNTPVDLRGKVVSALFASDGYMYIEEADRTSGIRIPSTGSGLAVGDRVNVTGNVTTYAMSGVGCERQISSPVITKVSAGTPLKPLGMNCLAVGGGPVPPYVAGVTDFNGKIGVGANNIGLLVRVAGKLTYRVANIFYIDDGSKIADISGRTGVMVIAPDMNIPAAVGSMVSVTGIVEGSVPTGWTANRRCIHLRSYSDLGPGPSAGTISGTVTSGGVGLVGATVATTTGGA